VTDAKTPAPPLPPGRLDIGPVRCGWMPHRHGTPAEPLVRAWLGQILDTGPLHAPLARSARGRPLPGPDHGGLDLNWSHSGDGLLVAAGRGIRVGADLEYLRPRPRALPLARRFFTAREARLLEAMPDDARQAAFVRLWCAKEAVLKAHGEGLSFGLHRLEFALGDDGWLLADCDPALGPAGAWAVHAFMPAPGYLASLAWTPSA
jgi:4'-phosphopantetheinyl transferase